MELKSHYNKMKLPKIKTLQDFEDPVEYCFYMLGYTEGTRGVLTVEPEPDNKKAYEEGVREGEAFVRWLLIAAINNKN
jgi:hypothetical protein